MGLEIFLQIDSEIAAKTEYEIVLEYFCGMNLRLRQSLELS